jgi:UDP-2,3-diacylglucosamine hydrolase
MLHLSLLPHRKLYFASDFHLGSHSAQGRDREAHVLRWLDLIRADAQAVFLVGDVFDFWFEYRKVVPKGFIRFLGKVAALRDAGIEFYFFTGNHDLWLRDYLPNELGVSVFHEPVEVRVTSGPPAAPVTRLFLVGHGDGLGPGDWTYRRILKPIFTSPLSQWAFRWLHPDLGMALAHRWSNHSRHTKAGVYETFQGERKEWLLDYCLTVEKEQHHDYYVFGHRHLPLDLPVGPTSRYLNLGDWVNTRTYAVYGGKELTLTAFQTTSSVKQPK